MKIALVNPPWSFDGSIYFGCREPHLPLEYGYARALLTDAGHDAAIFDAQIDGIDTAALQSRVADFAPDMIVVTTAPSYLFWRCAPPELRIPQHTLAALDGLGALTVAVGPHASSTPRIAVKKLGVDAGVQGECEEVLAKLADTPREAWGTIAGLVRRDSEDIVVQGGPQAVDMTRLPALRWHPGIVPPHGRDWLDKDCKLSTEELRDRLIHAKRSVPFVQANLIMTEGDDPEIIARWREELQQHGVWANEPVPLFPYPGSPEYRRIWGLPDDDAWERALNYYLDRYASFSDIQEAHPRRLAELERAIG